MAARNAGADSRNDPDRADALAAAAARRSNGALEASGLADQIELVKLTPEYLNTEEMSKLWTATQSHLRPTAAYVASVVLIEASAPVRSPLPVLTRGPVDPVSQRDRGVVVEAGLEPPLPTLEAVAPPGGQPVARLGEIIDLTGHHLDGTGRTVLLGNDRFAIEQNIAALLHRRRRVAPVLDPGCSGRRLPGRDLSGRGPDAPAGRDRPA